MRSSGCMFGALGVLVLIQRDRAYETYPPAPAQRNVCRASSSHAVPRLKPPGKRARGGGDGRQRVAALLHDQRRQAEPTVELAGAGVGIGGDRELGEWVVAVRVPAGGEDQRLAAVRG